MEKMILGLLLLRRLTVYEIREIIKVNFQDIYSDSLGSIQAAIKKLISAKEVVFSETVEKGVNKKRYSITEKGRKVFMEWAETPADITKTKTAELGKLLFMGIVPAKKRIKLLEDLIIKLEEKYENLLFVKKISSGEELKTNALVYWNNDREYQKGIQNAAQNKDMAKNADDIAQYQLLTLQFGIDYTKFQIDWFKNFKEKLI